jgi:hypothetical protein
MFGMEGFEATKLVCMKYEKQAKQTTSQPVNKLMSQTIHFQLVYLLEELY